MSEINHCIEKGQTIFFTCGCYSDYRVMSHAIVKKRLNFTELLEQFLTEVEDTAYGYEMGNAFISWLDTEGFIEEFNTPSVHLGDYFDFEVEVEI